MNSIIICEGETDATLLQYYLEKKYAWEHLNKSTVKKLYQNNKISSLSEYPKAKIFKYSSNLLAIVSADSSSKLFNVTKSIDDYNKTTLGAKFDKIVIISDNDDLAAKNNFFDNFNKFFNDNDYTFINPISNNTWLTATYINYMQKVNTIEVLPLLIPFNEDGALETVLLNGIKEKSDVHKQVVEFSYNTIDTAHALFNEHFLKGRSDCLKAKFDFVLTILTTREEYARRKEYLQESIKWEDFDNVNSALLNLSYLSE